MRRFLRSQEPRSPVSVDHRGHRAGLLRLGLGFQRRIPGDCRIQKRHRLAQAQDGRSRRSGGHPSDAIVLFDGKSMSAWEGGDKWIVQDGCAIANKQSIRSKQSFGDCQLHVEWATPAVVTGHGQGRGNSGVFMMGKFEIQVLDSYQQRHLSGRPGRRRVQAAPAAGQRLPQAGRVADLRHRLPRRPISTSRASCSSRHSSPCSKTACWCSIISDPGRDLLHGAGRLPPASAQGTHRVAIPRQPGSIPQYLDPRAVSGRQTVVPVARFAGCEHFFSRFARIVLTTRRCSIGPAVFSVLRLSVPPEQASVNAERFSRYGGRKPAKRLPGQGWGEATFAGRARSGSGSCPVFLVDRHSVADIMKVIPWQSRNP